MAKYRKKPITITAVQYKEAALLPEDFAESPREYFIDRGGRLVLHAVDGDQRAADGDYIVRGRHGELYHVKQNIFEDNYELIE